MLGALYRAKRFGENDWDGCSFCLNLLPALIYDVMRESQIPNLNDTWFQMTGMQTEYRVNDIPLNSGSIHSDFPMKNDAEPNTPRIRLKSDIHKAQKPFSLEASTLKAPLRDLAKSQVANTLTRKDYNCSELDHAAVEWQQV